MKQIILTYNPNFRVTTVIESTPSDDLSITYESDDNVLNVSDGFHSFSELYEHRHALFCALCKVYDGYITPLGSRVSCFKSKLHFDGTMFDDSFIVFMLISNGETREQISYHLPIEWWDKFKLMTTDKAPKHDGHTGEDVIERLGRL